MHVKFGDKASTLNKIPALQGKTVRIINFRAKNYDAGEPKYIEFQITSNF